MDNKKEREKEAIQKQQIIGKMEEALKESYYIMIVSPTEVFEAQHNKSLPEIIHLLDVAHIRKVNEEIALQEKQNKSIGLFQNK